MNDIDRKLHEMMTAVADGMSSTLRQMLEKSSELILQHWHGALVDQGNLIASRRDEQNKRDVATQVEEQASQQKQSASARIKRESDSSDDDA